ncbi:unnamed protein product [Sphagnum jensenii]|uniref:Endoglucanase n=1 Tax=Sphagnum jensenii TaxID=128206 RepID=A0ABP0XHU9_9BRYO
MGVGHHVRLQRVTYVVAASGLVVMVVVLFVDLLGMSGRAVTSVTTVQYNYSDALMRSLLYFEGQRSGKLPTTQRVTWRGDSALEDGESAGVNLTGGYYDAGDNVKFGFPMAFTITMLSWSVIEYKSQLQSTNQLSYALSAIQWGTDYFLKAHVAPNVFFGEVGDGNSDHACWMRPEDMTTPRGAYQINASHPGSDLAGETAAAMAAASMAFQTIDANYSATLVTHAQQLFNFANTYRGKYSDSITVVDPFYDSYSGYDDELLWAAIWLWDATGNTTYLNYFINNAASLGGTGTAMNQFSWDNKYVGVQLKATKLLFDGTATAYTSTLQAYQAKAEYFLCAALQKNKGPQIQLTPGGLLSIQNSSNMQYVATSAFVLTVAYDYYNNAGKTLSHCTSSIQNSQLLAVATSQVNYILGKNPRNISYLVGFGSSFPQQVHHRGASIPSIKVHPQLVSCNGGYNGYFNSPNPNPNVHNGALVAGPDQNDNFQDVRSNHAMTEPSTYNTAPLVGVLARLAAAVGSNSSEGAMITRAGVGAAIAPVTTTKVATPVEITQSLADQWELNGKIYNKYIVTISNKSTMTLTSVKLVVHNLGATITTSNTSATTSIQGLAKTSANGNIYMLPHWITSFKPDQTITFTYVHHPQYGAAKFFLLSYGTSNAYNK